MLHHSSEGGGPGRMVAGKCKITKWRKNKTTKTEQQNNRTEMLSSPCADVSQAPLALSLSFIIWLTTHIMQFTSEDLAHRGELYPCQLVYSSWILFCMNDQLIQCCCGLTSMGCCYIVLYFK